LDKNILNKTDEYILDYEIPTQVKVRLEWATRLEIVRLMHTECVL